MTPREIAEYAINYSPPWPPDGDGPAIDRVTKHIEQAIEAERQACIQIAREVQDRSAQLMGEVQHDATKEYYRGRGLGAATIAEKIRQRGNS